MGETIMQAGGKRRSKRGGAKLHHRRRVVPLSSVVYPAPIDWAEVFNGSAVQQPAIPSKSVGDLILDAVKAAYNQTWKETDPESYFLYQGTWKIAPHWPQELDWLLNLTALWALARGASRIADHSKK